MTAWAPDVTRDAVRHFAWGVGDNNPLWLDAEHAELSRWQGILAPPCFAYAAHETTIAPGFDDRPRIYRSVDWRWFDVIRLGTRLTATARLIDTREDGETVIQYGSVDFHGETGDGAQGPLLASATTECWRPVTPFAPSSSTRRYTNEELTAIERSILAETRRGAEARYWEDAATGDRLDTLTKGPLSIMDIVAWCAGALGVRTAADGVAAGGLVDEAATGPQLSAWFAHLVTDWAGDDAFLHQLHVTVAEQPGLGSTTFLNGTVADHSQLDGLCTVDLKLAATDPDGRELAKADAMVALPSRDHGPVPLPINTEPEDSRL
ncbi:MAG: MaoC family dehydratase N-terminal domain-containing protein [Alphaproteobacteria bacterium]|nr:MaoC family dehydratase N-terminal domain-containing protein [Alphaproteobacteria bacterium]